MSAALFALRAGARTVILEKNEKLGKKLYITGKGRCNLSNTCDLEAFLSSVPRNPRFLHSALAFLSPEELRSLLDGMGCQTKVERGGRVFPVSDKASDVTRAFTRALAGCELRLQSTATGICVEDGAVLGVFMEGGGFLPANAVIVSTGGAGYPQTGSTGDGYRFAAETGHRVSPPLASLVPLLASDPWIPAVQGLSLRNVVLTAACDGKQVFSRLGELLFTHFGLSGPLVLALSSHIAGIDPERLSVRIDLKPALSAERLQARLNTALAAGGAKALRSLLAGFMPLSLALVFEQICGVDSAKRSSQVTAGERAALLKHMKGIPIRVTGPRPLSEAVVTRGGVDVRQVDPSTMESRRISGLYFAGEVLDVDGYTGGYNLHIAFATGALAGSCAARKALTEVSP